MYAYVMQGAVRDLFGVLPECWENTSNFSSLDKDNLALFGFYPVQDVRDEILNEFAHHENEQFVFIPNPPVVLRTADLVLRPADEVRAILNVRINAVRERKLAAGMEFDGNMFDSDTVSKMNVISMIVAGSAGLPLPIDLTWRTQDNQDVPMTFSKLIMLGGALLVHSNNIYKQSWAKKAALQADEYPHLFDIESDW